MLPTAHLLAFAVTAFVLIVIPGPSVLFVLSRTMVLGRPAGVATVAGNTAGEFAQVIAVAFGIGPLVERSVTVFTVLKLAGAGYLVFLGVQAVRQRRSLAAALGTAVERKTAVRIVIDGFTVGATNPKSVVFFAAMLPQFADPRSANVPAQIIVLGTLFALIALVSDSAWALLAGRLRGWLASSPRRMELLGGAGGLAMIAIGTRLAVTGRKDLSCRGERGRPARTPAAPGGLRAVRRLAWPGRARFGGIAG